MDLEIQGQHVEVDGEWRRLVESRAALLSARHPKLVRLHVTFRHEGHHRQIGDTVHLLANVAGETVSITKEGDVLDTLHGVLDAAERVLGRHGEHARSS